MPSLFSVMIPSDDYFKLTSPLLWVFRLSKHKELVLQTLQRASEWVWILRGDFSFFPFPRAWRMRWDRQISLRSSNCVEPGSLTLSQGRPVGPKLYAGIFWHILPAGRPWALLPISPTRHWQHNPRNSQGTPGNARFGISLPLKVVGKLSNTCMEILGEFGWIKWAKQREPFQGHDHQKIKPRDSLFQSNAELYEDIRFMSVPHSYLTLPIDEKNHKLLEMTISSHVLVWIWHTIIHTTKWHAKISG